MKNVEKIMTAMEKAFSGHKVEISCNFNSKIRCVFIDDVYIGAFEEGFCNKDFDNPEIEIKVKAVERGFKEWQNESHPNN